VISRDPVVENRRTRTPGNAVGKGVISNAWLQKADGRHVNRSVVVVGGDLVGLVGWMRSIRMVMSHDTSLEVSVMVEIRDVFVRRACPAMNFAIASSSDNARSQIMYTFNYGDVVSPL